MESTHSFLGPLGPDFGLNNIPFGVFHLKTEAPSTARCASRLGDFVVDLAALLDSKKLTLTKGDSNVFARKTLNEFIGLGKEEWSGVRKQVQGLFASGSALKDEEYKGKFVHAVQDCRMLLPVQVGDYTDFYSSRNHAFNVGTMFRGPENALKENWTWLPVGYHGRASSIVVSPTSFRRPSGQVKAKTEKTPRFAKSNKMDFELEMVTVVGKDNALGSPVGINEASNHIFGYMVMNDVSVRDVQAWEYIPLGPFTGKNCLTVVSQWIVTAEALEPFRVELPKQDPAPLEYLAEPFHSTYDVELAVSLQTAKADKPFQIGTSNMKFLYWSPEQQLAHHTVTGCNLRVGDMLGSGTISGLEKEQMGSFLEMSWNGTREVDLPETNEKRKFWQDGDLVVMTGRATKGGESVGFGTCEARLLA